MLGISRSLRRERPAQPRIREGNGGFREAQGARGAAYAPICSSDMAKSTAFPLIFILPFPAEWQ